MNRNLLFIIAVLSSSATLLCSGCHKNETSRPTNQCDTTNTTFNQLYNNLLSNPINQNDTTMDLETHSYTFQVTSAETICKIGYQNLSPSNTQPYLIEIYDSTTNTLLYSGSHIFSSTTTSYVSINPIALAVGDSYIIKRILNTTTSTLDLIGRIIINYNSQITFPIVFGNLKITSSSVDNPFSLPNPGLPFIDIVFQ